MKQELDIYNYPKRLEVALRQLNESTISLRNKELILQFRDFCSLEGIGIPRIERYIGVLKKWAELLQVDFDKASKEDIMKAVRIVQESKHTAWTKATYKIMLKRFYK